MPIIQDGWMDLTLPDGRVVKLRRTKKLPPPPIVVSKEMLAKFTLRDVDDRV